MKGGTYACVGGCLTFEFSRVVLAHDYQEFNTIQLFFEGQQLVNLMQWTELSSQFSA